MKPAYQLKQDFEFISKVQKTTLSTEHFGIEPTHGLFGSSEWWEQISSGKLPLYTLRGVITQRYMGSMGDWPEITVQSDTGEIWHWTRRVNSKEQDALYVPGQRIEIDYVIQRHRAKSFDKGSETKQVIVRVEPSAHMQVPGSYEKLRAREIAQGIFLRYSVILETAHELSELSKAPSVMGEQAQSVFTNVADEIPDLRTRRRNDGAMTALLDRWKDAVLAAWKELAETKSQ
jgi:hypothetical protein